MKTTLALFALVFLSVGAAASTPAMSVACFSAAPNVPGGPISESEWTPMAATANSVGGRNFQAEVVRDGIKYRVRTSIQYQPPETPNQPGLIFYDYSVRDLNADHLLTLVQGGFNSAFVVRVNDGKIMLKCEQ